MTRTKFFQVCRGVFEGGGCRGAAHIGAYAEAIESGVNFSEVAGTSAGSIIAALIGAGATPEFLKEKVASLDFESLFDEPKNRISPIFGRSSLVKWGSLPLYFCGKRAWNLRKILLVNGSFYSLQKLEDWLDDLLSELLPNAPKPITFESLILPTWIVAANLSGKRIKLWSQGTSPNEKVAMAVRCSCSIPVFFEPVELGNDLLVDGGVLSNLPTFVFANNSKSLGGRILAFRLQDEDRNRTQLTLQWLLERLINTMISGATDLQSSLLNRISYVRIPTGEISGTDFKGAKENVSTLLENGRTAMSQFLIRESPQLNDDVTADIPRYSQDELFDDVAREMETVGLNLIVSSENTEWFWRLFPSVIHWLFNQSRMYILTRPIVGKDKMAEREKQRREFLSKLGAKIVESTENIPRCILLSRNDDRHNAAFMMDNGVSNLAPYGSVYIGIHHRALIKTLLDTLERMICFDLSTPPTLTLVETDPTQLIHKLKTGVNQYIGEDIRLELKDVPLNGNDASPLPEMIVRRVRSFKFRQAGFMKNLYNKHFIPPFVPASILADGKVVSCFTPPVFEVWNDRLVAIEGNTRLLYCYRAGLPSISGLVVNGVIAPLPGNPVKMKRALLATSHMTPEDRIEGFDYTRFRSIEGASRPLNNN